MRLFEIDPDNAGWAQQQSNRYYINATHRWSLPGADCSVCGATWAMVGQDYPAIDLSGLPNEREYRKPRAVTATELDRLRRALLPLLPEGTVLWPGAQFGPLVGKAWGTFGDFTWVHSWIPLIRPEALARLQAAGLHSLVTVEPELTFRAKRHPPELLELHIAPHARLAPAAFSSDAPPCAGCGRPARKIERIVIDRSSVPQSLDLFRLHDAPALILATERFREAAEGLGLTDIAFAEVEVAA